MLNEVNSVVEFISTFLSKSKFESSTIDNFIKAFRFILCAHYSDHWFPEKPSKGSAYRCIRNNGERIDPLIIKAGTQAEIELTVLYKLLPRELTLWVDPENVSYRIGEEGSIGILFESVLESDMKMPISCKGQVLLHEGNNSSQRYSDNAQALTS